VSSIDGTDIHLERRYTLSSTRHTVTGFKAGRKKKLAVKALRLPTMLLSLLVVTFVAFSLPLANLLL
jgi:hypothetical protein